MRKAFADTFYWIAVVNPRDPWHKAAREARQNLGDAILVTTDEVLGEFLGALSKGGPTLRQKAVEMVRAILDNPNVRVIPQSRDSFLKGLDRYSRRNDKQYSLTDCISMNVMESGGISEVLTHDRHFEQERFTLLIAEQPEKRDQP